MEIKNWKLKILLVKLPLSLLLIVGFLLLQPISETLFPPGVPQIPPTRVAPAPELRVLGEEDGHPLTEALSENPLGPSEKPVVTYTKPTGDIQPNIGYQNNKFGLYIYAEVLDFVHKAAEIANSNGGDWGYVLVPYNVHDRNVERWDKLFRTLNQEHLIPIIQLWDLKEGEEGEVTFEAAWFLNQFAWPIKPRYISVYNEPNDERFWRNGTDPEDYAQILDLTITVFKDLNEDFFMLNGAFNSSARTQSGYLDEEEFLEQMNEAVPGIFERLDGWASHPYPQPNFTGSPEATGRNSIRAYEWELGLLEDKFGAGELPIFITETGWAHAEGKEHNPSFLSAEEAAENIRRAYENVWLPDEQVVAVTPFTIRYNPPYDHFSWITEDDEDYPQAEVIKEIEKVEGRPPVRQVVVETSGSP